MQTVSANIWERMGRSQELSKFQRGTRMPPVQRVQSWNFLSPKYSTFICQWYYNKVEAIGNNSNSAMKW